MNRLTQKNGDGYSLCHDNCPMRGQCSDSADCVEVLLNRLAEYEEAEEAGRLVRLPFIAMVEQSLQCGLMKPSQDQRHNGRYAVVYYDSAKWRRPLIDICGTPYNTDQAEIRLAELTGKGDAV